MKQFSADPPFGIFTNTSPASNMSFKNIAGDSFDLISLEMGSFTLLPVNFGGYLSGILQAPDLYTNTIGGGTHQNFTTVNLSGVTVDEIRFTMDQSTSANPVVGAFEAAIIPEPSSALLLGLAATLLARVSHAAQKNLTKRRREMGPSPHRKIGVENAPKISLNLAPFHTDPIYQLQPIARKIYEIGLFVSPRYGAVASTNPTSSISE